MKIAITMLLAALLAGCALVYRVPVIQGNVLSGEAVSKLELGMTKPQVRYVLGTPLINSDFGEQRWDYVFYFKNVRGQSMQSRLSVFFQDNQVVRIKGDESYQALLPEDRDQIGPNDVESAESRPILPDGRDTRPQS